MQQNTYIENCPFLISYLPSLQISNSLAPIFGKLLILYSTEQFYFFPCSRKSQQPSPQSEDKVLHFWAAPDHILCI